MSELKNMHLNLGMLLSFPTKSTTDLYVQRSKVSASVNISLKATRRQEFLCIDVHDKIDYQYLCTANG